MTESAIKVEALGKRYRIGQREPYVALRDVMTNALKAPLRFFNGANGNGRASQNNFIWSLRDVSLEIKQGEAVGLIGRNGAGKTTLLKILARVTKPTEGRAEVCGRIGSLLEVGTGFHPELTGRENIYLNGAILGMRKHEITRKFDEIVAFSGVEAFIDTPLKHYSSGMQTRLAFSVAAHLEPEILLVDEVLAVGDLEFQKKCLGKMGEVTRGGRTVLFVSHNLGAVKTLCQRAILLDHGKVQAEGSSHHVVAHYLRSQQEWSADPFSDCARTGNGRLRIRSFHLESPQGEILNQVSSGDDVVFAFGFENLDVEPWESLSIGYSINTTQEFGLMLYYSNYSGVEFRGLPGSGFLKCRMRNLPLAAGDYLVGARVVVSGDDVDWPQVLVPFRVIAGDYFGTGTAHVEDWAPVLVRGDWSLEEAPLKVPVHES